MLRVDVRTLRQGAATVDETVPPGDPAFEGLDLHLAGAVRVTGTLQTAGSGTYRFEGRVSGTTRNECRRCLAPVEAGFSAPLAAVFTTTAEMADDPGVYPLTEPVTAVDLTDAVREEVGLAVPTYPLCRDECAGLCPRCGADLNEGPCGCAAAPASL